MIAPRARVAGARPATLRSADDRLSDHGRRLARAAGAWLGNGKRSTVRHLAHVAAGKVERVQSRARQSPVVAGALDVEDLASSELYGPARAVGEPIVGDRCGFAKS